MAEGRYFDAAFARFALVSALSTATDFALASTLNAFQVSAFAATFFGCVGGGMVAFSLGRSWTFRAGNGRASSQGVRFLLVWAASALLNAAGVPLVLEALPSFSVAWVVVRGVVYVGWNYPLARWFVFSSQPRAARLSAP